MAKLETYVCDVCGSHKGAENGWWRIWEDTEGLGLTPWNSAIARAAKDAARADLCGQPCVLRRVEEYMTGMVKREAK